jgi:ligand-binding sensor domain-containing protein
MSSPKLPILGVFFLVVFFCTTGAWNSIAIAQSGSFTFEYLQEKYPEIDAYMDQVTMDPQGFLWFGGEVEVQRYDGYRIKTYPIRTALEQSDEKISPDAAPGFLTDSFGNFWVFSNIGLFVFQPAFDGFTRVRFKPPADFFYSDNEERPDVFVITAFMEDNLQNLWVGLKGGVLFYFPLRYLEDLKQKNGYLAESVWLPDDKIIPVWFQSGQYTKKGGEFVRTPYYTVPTFRPEVLKLLQDKDEDIWINSHSRIFRLVMKNELWVFGGNYFKNYPERFYWTKNLFLDSEKNLWIGAANYLIVKRDGKPSKSDLENVPQKFRPWTLPYGTDSLGQSLNFHFDWYEFNHDMGFQGHTGWIDNLYFDNRDQLFVLNEDTVFGYQ